MSFIDVQNEFMAHIRNPSSNPAPHGIEERRLAIYRDLFFNNILGFISSGFPVLKTLYSEQQWQLLVRRFFSEYDCKSPYFLDIAGEFMSYLSTHYEMHADDPIFMVELAHYEWIELDVSVAIKNETEQTINNADIKQAKLYFSHIARNLSYQFAVQKISESYQPQAPSAQPHYFVVYRDEEDDVQFLSTNAMTALLLSLIENNEGATFDDICQEINSQVPHFSYEQITQGAFITVQSMCERGIIVTKNQY